MVIIGITGTSGAGKGTVVAYLVKKGFVHYSARAFIVEEIERRGLSVNRNTMIDVANDLRKTHSSGYILEQLLAQAEEQGGNAVIESLRVLGEVDALHEKGGVLIDVDADVTLRYARVSARKSETDRVSFEEFVAQEKRESISDDPNKQSLFAVMQKADLHLMNNGTIEELERTLEKELAKRNLV
ncbi:TPA: hypothetical protein DEP58_01820 [Patescibacteria group bacterium]|nr:MAG: hypothetical protein UU98_C0018G0008 [Parcubacteria group bacterium GW2011_GWD2_42_14]HCC05026.1 hypothetical protein [Patescibacteria group bacterium]